MVNQAARKQLYIRIEVRHNKIKVNLLLADDTLFHCKVNNQIILAIKIMLKCFEMTLGVWNSITHAFSEILNCNTMEVPVK